MCALRGRLAARCSGRLTLTKRAHAQLRLSAAVMLRALLRPPPPRREPDDADVDALRRQRQPLRVQPRCAAWAPVSTAYTVAAGGPRSRQPVLRPAWVHRLAPLDVD